MELDGRGRQLLDAVAYAEDACRLGPVVALYVDADTGRPDFAGVQLDGVIPAERLVPLVRAHMPEDGRLVVALAADAVVGSPGVTGSDLSRDDTDALFRHYAESITGTSWGRWHRPGPLTGDGPVGLQRLTGAGPGDRSNHALSGS